MTLSPQFLDAIAVVACNRPGPRVIPWPIPGDPSGFVRFDTFSEWQTFWLRMSLPEGIPRVVRHGYERAQKLYLLGWIDFDLISSGEMTALSTLEYVLTDRYLGKEKDRRTRLITEKAFRENRPIRKGEVFWIDRIGFSDLLKYMVEEDSLSDEKLAVIHRCGGSVQDLLTGKREPSLAAMRHARAHGNPFGSGFEAGLLELIRDLVKYAYRDLIVDGSLKP